MFFLQEFDYEVKDRKGTENKVADHLYKLKEEAILKMEDVAEIDDAFPDEQVMAAYHYMIPWFTDFTTWKSIWFHQNCPFTTGIHYGSKTRSLFSHL